ncbi:hypothetical protein [Streptomyces sp. NPDC002537]
MALGAGADDHPTKPFRLTGLLARLLAHPRRPAVVTGPAAGTKCTCAPRSSTRW